MMPLARYSPSPTPSCEATYKLGDMFSRGQATEANPSFAKALYHTAEDNDVATFVDVVRTESSTYPRPVGIDSFMNPPYLWAPSRTREVYQKTIATSSFKDIHETHASNGRTYYYSDMYLSEAQARSLAEWYGVEQQRNP